VPLAFDDAALARLAIGATRIARSQRYHWLKKVVRQLEGHPPSPTARRLRKYRSRVRNGERVFCVTLDQVDLEELLIAARTLLPAARDDHAEVQAALQRLLHFLIADHHHGNAFPPDREIYDTVRVGLCLSALRREVSGGPSKRR
jgi:hypothetical protein